jgi:predicted acyl esterase
MRTSTLVVVVLALIGATPPALSQLADESGHDRRFAMPASKTSTVKWSATGSGFLLIPDVMDPVGCQAAVHDCDETLIRVAANGVLDVETSTTDQGTFDTDLHLYRSNSSGEPVTKLKDSAGGSPAEKLTARVTPGYYLVRIDYALGSGRIDAVARFTPVVPKPSKQFDYSRLRGLSRSIFRTTTTSLMLPMPDGREVYMEITRPKAKGRFGVILEASPYHGTLYGRDGARILPQPVDSDERPLGLKRYFAPRGYAVAMMDLRGTGKSQGCLDLMGPRDASDLKTVVEWLARQPWSNGRVGMVGHSYPGSTPMIAAAMRPKGLVTIVPSAGVSQMYEHLFHNGVPWAGTFGGGIAAYNLLAIQRALPDAIELPPELFETLPVPLGQRFGDNFGNDPHEAACGVTQSPAFTGESLLSGRRVKWHEDRDWRERATAWPGSVFLVHGVNDANARITGIEWFYARRGRPQDKAWIGQWDHGSGCCPNRRGTQWTFALHAWFDKHLLRRDVDTGPNVEVFLDSEVADPPPLDGREHVLAAGGLPMQTRTVSFNATPDGTLAGAAAPAGQVSFTGSPFDLVGVFGTGGNAEFVSGPLSQDLVAVGLPDVRVAWSQTLPRVHSVANVFVRSKDGDERRITNCAANPELRKGADTVTPVVPGQRVDLRMQCFTMAHRLRRGERLVLRVATSDFEHMPFFSLDPRVTVFTGPDATSLRLPVVSEPKLNPDTVDLEVRPGR